MTNQDSVIEEHLCSQCKIIWTPTDVKVCPQCGGKMGHVLRTRTTLWSPGKPKVTIESADTPPKQTEDEPVYMPREIILDVLNAVRSVEQVDGTWSADLLKMHIDAATDRIDALIEADRLGHL